MNMFGVKGVLPKKPKQLISTFYSQQEDSQRDQVNQSVKYKNLQIQSETMSLTFPKTI